MIRKALLLLTLLMLSVPSFAEGKKVLYVTFEPGRYHAYTPQLKVFREVAAKAEWDLSVITGTHSEAEEKMHNPDFAKGYDAVVYNFCLAHSKDMKTCSNIIAQTEKHGVPAMLIHCSMHSFWPTYKKSKNSTKGALGADYKGKAIAEGELVEKWNKENPGKAFPIWGDFTGSASTRHGARKPIVVTAAKSHPVLKRFPKEWTTPNTELYNNAYMTADTVPLLKGVQGKSEAVVMWSAPRGKSQIIGLSIGHGNADWQEEVFQNLLTDAVNYLAK